MEIDAALTLFSFVSFAALIVSWILAPLRAAAPISLPVVDAAQPTAAVAA